VSKCDYVCVCSWHIRNDDQILLRVTHMSFETAVNKGSYRLSVRGYNTLIYNLLAVLFISSQVKKKYIYIYIYIIIFIFFCCKYTVGTESIQTPFNFSLFVILQSFAKII